jgi:hypothetical protein
MKITDQTILSALNAYDGSTYLTRLEAGLALRAPFSTSDERQAALQSAFHQRVPIITPMGNVRTPPDEESIQTLPALPMQIAKNLEES